MKNVLRFAAFVLALAVASAAVPVQNDIPIPECGSCQGTGGNTGH